MMQSAVAMKNFSGGYLGARLAMMFLQGYATEAPWRSKMAKQDECSGGVSSQCLAGIFDIKVED